MTYKAVPQQMLDAMNPELREQQLTEHMRSIERAHGYSWPNHVVTAHAENGYDYVRKVACRLLELGWESGEYDPANIPAGYEKLGEQTDEQTE